MNSQTDLISAPEPVPSTSPEAETRSERAQFVDWMRSVAPYIHAFRNKTFVVGFGGEVVHQGLLNALVSDIALLQAISSSVRLPVIASGGAGTIDHMYQALTEGGAEAMLAASVFHFGELSIASVKQDLAARGLEIRP